MPSHPLQLLGVQLTTEPRAQLIARLRDWLSERTPRQIVTVNPEILVAGVRTATDQAIVQAADLCLADGAGLLAVATAFGLPRPERFTGVELVDILATIAADLGRSVYLLGAGPGVAAAAGVLLQQRHPKLRIAGAEEGIPQLTDERFQALDPTTEEGAVVQRVAAAKPGVLFVAFGHPKQERFIAAHKHELGASILVGVGGTFDYLAGRVRRAPRLLQTLWLEWLWRLVVEPWRITRIWTAIVVFPWLVVKDRIFKQAV